MSPARRTGSSTTRKGSGVRHRCEASSGHTLGTSSLRSTPVAASARSRPRRRGSPPPWETRRTRSVISVNAAPPAAEGGHDSPTAEARGSRHHRVARIPDRKPRDASPQYAPRTAATEGPSRRRTADMRRRRYRGAYRPSSQRLCYRCSRRGGIDGTPRAALAIAGSCPSRRSSMHVACAAHQMVAVALGARRKARAG